LSTETCGLNAGYQPVRSDCDDLEYRDDADAASAQDGPIITGLERQPFVAATRRLVEAIDFAGAPLSADVMDQTAGGHGLH
jgi:hypothetical protein